LPPAANSSGSFSLSRQLGLGIARIVIDPGHGGHDPGARARGLNEAELTLDIALRLEKLFAGQSGVEVVLTRRTDMYVQLEERTAIANRAGADLFLSIHANASDAPAARGIETYFLNFAANPEAEAVAARENASSAKTMGSLPDIVKAIAMNNKIDESRDFAAMVQRSLYDKLRTANKDVRNLGVKQAPFMVLIGATMPSVLAEISFMTNRQEGALLKTDAYRQQIAEALYQGVMRYQQSLKKAPAVARAPTASLPKLRSRWCPGSVGGASASARRLRQMKVAPTTPPMTKAASRITPTRPSADSSMPPYEIDGVTAGCGSTSTTIGDCGCCSRNNTSAVECQLTPRLRGERELSQCPDAHAGGTFRLVRFRFLRPRGAGDVDVHPRQIAAELLQEQGRRDGAARTPAGVREIGDLTAELFLVVVVDRHRPRAIAGAFARLTDCLDPVVG
jgi:N-acetylmuramoyl-L-alanine amidase